MYLQLSTYQPRLLWPDRPRLTLEPSGICRTLRNELERYISSGEVSKRNFIFARKSLVNHPTNGFYTAFANGESDNGANDNAANPPKRNAFKKHAVPKKCHLCHLFYILL